MLICQLLCSQEYVLLVKMELVKTILNRIFRMAILIVQYLGKTTLLKIIMEMMDPTKGTRVAHRNLKFGYFTQVSIKCANSKKNENL